MEIILEKTDNTTISYIKIEIMNLKMYVLEKFLLLNYSIIKIFCISTNL